MRVLCLPRFRIQPGSGKFLEESVRANFWSKSGRPTTNAQDYKRYRLSAINNLLSILLNKVGYILSASVNFPLEKFFYLDRSWNCTIFKRLIFNGSIFNGQVMHSRRNSYIFFKYGPRSKLVKARLNCVSDRVVHFIQC